MRGFSRLPRQLVSVSGADAGLFLQSLASIDIRKVEPGKLVFGAFLNPKGRILHDFFITKGEEDDFDLETSAASSLASYLNKFKLRKKVKAKVDENRSVFVVYHTPELGLQDPRFAGLGRRVWAPEVSQLEF
jgi:folate-binding Fe-S cluster repair protein YgfZ